MLRASPSKPLACTIKMPGDKSISHRAVMLGSLCDGVVKVENFLESEDCLHTLQAMQALGVPIEHQGESLTISGVGLHGLQPSMKPIECGNAGTLMRLLTGLLAGQPFDSTLVGDASLSARPMDRIIKPLETMGAQISGQVQDGRTFAPLEIHGTTSLKGIDYAMPIASAQVKSALMLATLYANGQSDIHELAPSRDHTERMLALMGLPVTNKDRTISLQSKPLTANTIEVPGDISSAAFFMVAATLIKGSHIMIEDVGLNETRQGVIHILREMGADITIYPKQGFEPVGDIEIRSADLKGIDIPEKWVVSAIDEFPILFIAACFAKGETTLRQAKELRVKEVDRLEVMANNLQACGVKYTLFEDGLSILGGGFKGGHIHSRGDHRIAMAFAIAGCCGDRPVTIQDYACINTSFPSFIKLAHHCALELTSEDKV